MKEKAEKLFHLIQDSRKQSVAMQHKLLIYWLSMLLVVLGTLFVVLNIVGVFSGTEKKLQQILTVQHKNTVAILHEQLNIVTAQGMAISEQAARMLDNLLYTEPTEVLNDDADKLKILEKNLYAVLNTALRSSPCNGVYLILDATTNTAAENADTSRAGLYLRFANLNAKYAVDQDVTLYRGIPDVARAHQLELHNRWKLEFDTSLIDKYDEMLRPTSADILKTDCLWTKRTSLTDTWESVVLSMIPIRGSGNIVRGICGVELSDLYFRLSYPAQESEFGSMITLLAPIKNNTLLLQDSMIGGLGGVYLDHAEVLSIKKGKSFHTYTGQSGTFLGVHSSVNMHTSDGSMMYAVTLVPKEQYKAAVNLNRIIWFFGLLLFLILVLIFSVFLSRRFVRPISQSLAAVQSETALETESSGISEIDSLLAFMRSRNQNPEKGALPADIAELFDAFAERAQELTTAERNILKYYADGREVNEVAELAFISIHTVRRHNANIYKKLGIGSRDELILYMELFRRCGRLDELLNQQQQSETE